MSLNNAMDSVPNNAENQRIYCVTVSWDEMADR
jgi:hypothetical protein